jgi:hypothetical protein
MSTGVASQFAIRTLDQGLVAEVWASDLADGCRIRGKNTASAPTKNIITHKDIRHTAGTGATIQRGWDGAGRDRVRFGPGQKIALIPASAPGASNDTGKTVKLGVKAITSDGLAKSLQIGQSTPGYVSQSCSATSFGSSANVVGSWTYNSAYTTDIKDAGNPKDWNALAGGPYVFRMTLIKAADTAFDVSFTATGTDNLIAEIGAQLVILINAALNTRNGTSGVAYCSYTSGTHTISITNTSVSGNPALALGQFTLTCTVKDASAVELTDQFHTITSGSTSTTAAVSCILPPDFDLILTDPQFYRDADLTASALPDYTTESRDGHWFANYGFTNACTTGGGGKYLDNDAGTARGYLGVEGTYTEVTVQMIVAQMERTTATRYFYAPITDDEYGSVASSTFALGSYQSNELFISPDQSTAWESGISDLFGMGAQIITHTVRIYGQVARKVFLQELCVLYDHTSAPWSGIQIKGLWCNGTTGSFHYDPTTSLKSRLYALRFWNRSLSEPEIAQSIADWRGEANYRGISLGQVSDVVITADADSLTAWRTAAYGSWPYPLFEDAAGLFDPRLIIVNTANGGSGYLYLDANGYESSNGTSEDFINFETLRVIPAITACKQMGALSIVFRADGTNNKNQIKSGGVADYETLLNDVSRARLRAAGADYIFEHMTIARGGDATFDPLRQTLNANRLARVGTLIDGVADITGTPLDDYAEATGAMTTASSYFSTDGIHLKPFGQLVRADLAATLILGARPISYALREDGGRALREDGGYEIRD